MEREGKVKIGNILAGKGEKLLFVAGPCVIEPGDRTFHIAEKIAELKEKTGENIIFKASYDKANRTSIESYRGPGLEEGMKVLEKIKSQFNLPLTTDVHCSHDIPPVSEVVDMIQIPAFLSRQTDLLLEAGRTGKAVNIKKGQFMSAHQALLAAEKVWSTGNMNTIITERGTFFGYSDLVVDMRNIFYLKRRKLTVLFDATHSLQKPALHQKRSGGDNTFVREFALTAVAAGADGIFAEVHINPQNSLSDRDTIIDLKTFERMVIECREMREYMLQKRWDL